MKALALAFVFLPFLAFSQTVTVQAVNDSTFQIVTESSAIDGSSFKQVSKYMTLAEIQAFLFQQTMQANAQAAQAQKQAQATVALTSSYKKEFERRGGKYEQKVNEVYGKTFSGAYKIQFGDQDLGKFVLDEKMFLSGKGGNYPVEIVNPATIRVSGLAKDPVTLDSQDGMTYMGVGDEKKIVIKKVSNQTDDGTVKPDPGKGGGGKKKN